MAFQNTPDNQTMLKKNKVGRLTLADFKTFTLPPETNPILYINYTLINKF